MRSDRGNALGISATAPPDVAQPGGTTSAIVASAMSMAAIRACDLIIARLLARSARKLGSRYREPNGWPRAKEGNYERHKNEGRGTLLMNNAEAGATAPLFGSDTN
jgi:hypothetical protein